MSECKVIQGDCLEVLRELEDNSVDAVVTDPPYGLSNTKPAQVADVLKAWVAGDDNVVPEGKGFMGASWDGFVPPPAVWKECLRVLKPGGHMAVFAGARTQDLMGMSIRLAGFEIRDTLGWIYGSGFPKSHDIGKAIDKRPGVHHHRDFAAHLKERREAAGLSRQDVSERVVGTRSGACWNWEHHQFPKYEWWPALRDLLDLDEGRWGRIIAEADREVISERPAFGIGGNGILNGHSEGATMKVTVSSTDAAKQWDGWGTALKPAIEPIILARKPLDGTVAANVLAHGVGGLNIDASRVGSGGHLAWSSPRNMGYHGGTDTEGSVATKSPAGRFPANVLLDEHAAAEMDKQSGVLKSGALDTSKITADNKIFGKRPAKLEGTYSPNEGGASRFFPVFKYQAKAPKRERPVIEREDGTKIQHPTVKPLTLLEWLVTLITPPGGTVLDPFAGSGTTLQAARNKNFNAIGIEREPEYCELIAQRLAQEVLFE